MFFFLTVAETGCIKFDFLWYFMYCRFTLWFMWFYSITHIWIPFKSLIVHDLYRSCKCHQDSTNFVWKDFWKDLAKNGIIEADCWIQVIIVKWNCLWEKKNLNLVLSTKLVTFGPFPRQVECCCLLWSTFFTGTAKPQ